MKQMDWKKKIQEYIRENKLRRRWYKLTAILASAAIVVTGIAMILPAITMENSPQMLECQIDVHTHTDSCYGDEGNILWFICMTVPAMQRTGLSSVLCPKLRCIPMTPPATRRFAC